MLRKLTIAGLIIAGMLLVVSGAQKWLDQRAARKVLDSFIVALKEGDREQALALLDSQQRDDVEAGTRGDNADSWTPHRNLKYRIHHIEISGNRAMAQLWIEKDGFVIQPRVHLIRSETSLWKISHIENLQIDPLWEDVQRELARQSGENLAKEIGEALRGRPGVTVERVPLGETPR